MTSLSLYCCIAFQHVKQSSILPFFQTHLLEEALYLFFLWKHGHMLFGVKLKADPTTAIS